MRICATTLILLSVALSLATASLWLRSYWRADDVSHDMGGHWGRLCIASSSLGRIWIAAGTHWSEEDRPAGWQIRSDEPDPVILGLNEEDQPLWNRFGFAAGNNNSAVFDAFEVALPHWFLLLLTAMPAFAVLAARWRTCRRNKTGFCTRCGYDLRATPDRCPECGLPMKSRESPMHTYSNIQGESNRLRHLSQFRYGKGADTLPQGRFGYRVDEVQVHHALLWHSIRRAEPHLNGNASNGCGEKGDRDGVADSVGAVAR